jgi:hypothetical protein
MLTNSDCTNISLAGAFNIVCNEMLVTLQTILHSPLELLYLINPLKCSSNCKYHRTLSPHLATEESYNMLTQGLDLENILNVSENRSHRLTAVMAVINC